MRKRHGDDARVPQDSLLSGGHLTDEALIRSLDGELSPKETADVGEHVLSCWSCRSRKQAIEDGIADLVDYQNAVTARYLPPSLEERAFFLARLDAVASESGRPSQLRVWLDGAIRLLAINQTGHVAQIACVLAIIASGFAFYALRTPLAVSADELMSRAVESDVRSLHSAADPVVVQKLRISLGKESLTRTIYRDVAHERITSRTEADGPGGAQIRAAYLESSLDWDSQLDAETFRRWRATRPSSNDRVQRLGNHQLVLDTVFSTGQVSEAHLTVRIPDYHAIEESFRFQDHSEIEIAELSYDVVPLAAVPGDIFRALPPPAVAQLPTGATLGSVLPSNAELAKAELQAEVVLHGINADLGEQINITANVDREVLIEGIVEGDARKQQLQSALQGVPHTHLHLLTIDEAAHQPPSPSVARVAQTADSSVQVMVAAPPLLESRLNVRFPDKDQRAAYVNQALSLAS